MRVCKPFVNIFGIHVSLSRLVYQIYAERFVYIHTNLDTRHNCYSHITHVWSFRQTFLTATERPNFLKGASINYVDAIVFIEFGSNN